MLGKDRLSKKTTQEYDLSCIVRKDGTFFSENMILLFRQKMKDDNFSKNTWKYDISCIFGKDGICFSYKYDITLLSKKQR